MSKNTTIEFFDGLLPGKVMLLRFSEPVAGGPAALPQLDRAGLRALHHGAEPGAKPGDHGDGLGVGLRLARGCGSAAGAGHAAAARVRGDWLEPWFGLRLAGTHRIDRCDLRGQPASAVCQHRPGTDFLHAHLAGLACGPESPYLRD